MKLYLKIITFLIVISFQKTQSQTIDTLIDVGNHKLHFKIIKGKGIPILFGTSGFLTATNRLFFPILA